MTEATPLWKKLGIPTRDDAQVVLCSAPRDFEIPDLAGNVSLRREHNARLGRSSAHVVIAFFRNAAEMHDVLEKLAPRIFPDGAIWAAWPRHAAGHESDITDNAVRSVALPLGLVDVKVAALGVDWSGLRLVWRREARGRPAP